MLFLFDENCSEKICSGIKILEEGNHRSPIKVDVIHAVDFMGKRGASDPELIEAATKRDCVIITHDSDFRRIKHYKKLLIEHQVGYIYFKTPKGGYHYWDVVKSFINKWEELKEKIKNDKVPFAYEISKTGSVQKVPF